MAGKKLIKGRGGLKMVTIDSELKSAFEIEEPPWDDDSKFQFCSMCMKKFTFTARKHHCRRCGKIFCADCCHEKTALPRLCYVDPERVCKNCIPLTKAENLFFSKHIKVLLDGAPFILQDEKYVQCYLDPTSKQELLFKSMNETPCVVENPVKFNDILATQQITDVVEGNEELVGIILMLKDDNGKRRVKIVIKPSSSNNDKSHSFLDALQQAVKLLYAN